MESFIAVNDETEAEAGVNIVEDLVKDLANDNLEDKVNNEMNERDYSYTSSAESKVSRNSRR